MSYASVVEKAVAAERERCAKIAEDCDRGPYVGGITGSAIADKIRNALTHTQVSRLREALEAVDSEIALEGHLKELVDDALASEE